MKNKNNIIRQIYLAILRNNIQLDTKISKIINYVDVRPIAKTNPYGEVPLALSLRSDNRLYYTSIQNHKTSILPANKNYSSISFPFYEYLDIERIRMFMFRYYKGHVNWNKLFFGNEERDRE